MADALSRIHAISTTPLLQTVSIEELANAQKDDTELNSLLSSQTQSSTNSASLKLEKCAVADLELYCDVTKPGYKRPFVPRSLRHRIFLQYHNLAHPGVRRTRKLISTRYVWPTMNTDIGNWTRQCLNCQRSKITRHTRTPISNFSACNRLEHVHIDIIGRLPTSDTNNYCLTMIDRATHWMEVAPIPDMSAATIVDAFISTWIARYGCPAVVTTDQGRQFESQLFQEFSKTLGTKRIRTCAYHPQSNGLIENLH